MSVPQSCNFHCFHSPSMEFFGYLFPIEERAEQVTERIKTVFNKAQQKFYRLSCASDSNSVGLFTLDENNRPWGIVVPPRIESLQEAIDQVIALAENAAITKSFANVMHPLLAESPAPRSAASPARPLADRQLDR
ncbi:MAG: hypothetical protein H7A36_00075 [Chlamydiales bacterium]|nr:hypothetical protein [Chlamydiales bacterium]